MMARGGGGAKEGALEVAHVGGDGGADPRRRTGVRVRRRWRGDGGERRRPDLEEAGAGGPRPGRWPGAEVVAGGRAGELLDDCSEVVLADVVYLRRRPRWRRLADLLAVLVDTQQLVAR